MLFTEKLEKAGYKINFKDDNKAEIEGRSKIIIIWQKNKIIIKTSKFLVCCKSAQMDVKKGIIEWHIIMKLEQAKIKYEGIWYKWKDKVFIPDLWIVMCWSL